MMERVVVQHHVGDSPEVVVKKVWCFDTSNIEQYDHGAACRGGAGTTLFRRCPRVKGSSSICEYVDNFAGKVSVCCCASICTRCGCIWRSPNRGSG